MYAKPGISPLRFAISMNMRRRHLTADQRAIIAQGILPILEDEARQRQLLTLKQFSDKQNGKAGALPYAWNCANTSLYNIFSYSSTLESNTWPRTDRRTLCLKALNVK